MNDECGHLEDRHLLSPLAKGVLKSGDAGRKGCTEAAKNANTILIKYRSSSFNVFQCVKSWEKSISSALQKQSICFLYASHIDLSVSGNITNLFGFSFRSFASRLGTLDRCSLPQVRLLLDKGADPFAVCHNGQSAIHFAMASQKTCDGQSRRLMRECWWTRERCSGKRRTRKSL